MRPGQQNKRGRGRGNNNNGGGGNNNFNRKGGNPLSRSYDSSGPDIKIRGTAQHIAEKYAQLGRDAHSSGDRVMAENYLQHAEHYNRIIAAAQAQMQERFQHQDRGSDYQDNDGNVMDQDDMDGGDTEDLSFAQQPVIEDQQPRHHHQQRREFGQPGQNPQPQNNQNNPAPRASYNPQAQNGQPPQGEGRRDREDRNLRRERRPRPDRREEQAAAQEQPAVETHEGVAEPVVKAEKPRPARKPEPVVDAAGPQPEIEGVPAEVAAEQAEVAAAVEAAPRRRGRPRRKPVEDGGDAKPALADAGE